MADERRDSIGVPRESNAGQLLRRNREIAEVRDNLVKAEKQLTAIQSRNHVLLEESSELDSEVSRQCQRCAVSEQRMSGLEDEAREQEEEHAKQQAASEAQHELQMKALSKQEDVMRLNESELAAKRAEADAAEAELQGLEAELQAEEAALEDVRRQRQAPPRPSIASPAQQAQKAELEAVRARCDEQSAEAVSTRKRVDSLEALVAAESARRDELGSTYRQAVSEESKAAPRWEALESALAARGGDIDTTLGRVRRAAGRVLGDDTHDDVTAAAADAAQRAMERAAELHSEHQESEDHHQELQANLARLKEIGDMETIKLQTALDDARGELQRNMMEHAQKSSGEVSRLEAAVESERQKTDFEATAEQRAAERVKQLQAARVRAQGRRETAMETMRAEAVAEATQRARLNEELSRAQSELTNVEAKAAASAQRVADLQRQQELALADGDRRAAKVRAMLEDLWRSIRMQAARVEGNEAFDHRKSGTSAFTDVSPLQYQAPLSPRSSLMASKAQAVSPRSSLTIPGLMPRHLQASNSPFGM